MATKTEGKRFETEFKESMERTNGIAFDRIHDNMSGFMGANFYCDFIAYYNRCMFYIECKETQANTLNFKSAFQPNQWDGLLKKSMLGISGLYSGVLVWFFSHDITAFIEISTLEEMRKAGKKSLHVNDILDNNIAFKELKGEKKRKYYTYNAQEFFDSITTYGIR